MSARVHLGRLGEGIYAGLMRLPLSERVANACGVFVALALDAGIPATLVRKILDEAISDYQARAAAHDTETKARGQ